MVSRYVIAAMLVDENKTFRNSSFCSSTSNCTLQHCYLCPQRLVANHLLLKWLLEKTASGPPILNMVSQFHIMIGHDDQTFLQFSFSMIQSYQSIKVAYTNSSGHFQNNNIKYYYCCRNSPKNYFVLFS